MKKTKRRALYVFAALLGALFVLSCLVGFAACGEGSTSGDEGEHTHTYSSEVTTSATCTEKGVRTYTCSCGDSYTEEIDVNPDNHDYVSTAVEATCSAAGYTTYRCSRCGHTYTATGDPATGNHAWDAGVTTATCEAAGMTIYTCELCGATKYEAAPALGHDLDNGVVTTDATCTADGVRTYTCANCGETKTEAIEALGHNLTTTTATATCTTKGSVTETCSRCGYTAFYQTDALGHELVGKYCCDSTWTYTCAREDCEETFCDDSVADALIASVTLIATDETSLKSAVAWNKTDAPLTVKLDSSTYVCSDCCTECACEDCCADCTDCEDCCAEGCCTECEYCAECTDCCEDCCTECACEDCEGVPTITLNNSLTIGSDLTSCPAYNEANAVKLTLDLNGNDLSSNNTTIGQTNSTIIVKATATLTVTGEGTVDASVDNTAALYNEGTVILEGGTFERSKEEGTEEYGQASVNSYYTVENHGDMTIEDGAVIFNAGNYSTCLKSSGTDEENTATLTINGGKIYGGKYAVKNDYSGKLVMTGGQLGGLRSETDALPYRALDNYDEATITGGTLLGGNGGAVSSNLGATDGLVSEGLVIYNNSDVDSHTDQNYGIERGDERGVLTIGDENGNGPEIIYEGINSKAAIEETKISYYGDGETTTPFATGVAIDSGTVNFKAGTIKCTDTAADKDYTFMGVYLTNGEINVFGGTISGEAAIVINPAEGGDVSVDITGGTFDVTDVIYIVTDNDRTSAAGKEE